MCSPANEKDFRWDSFLNEMKQFSFNGFEKIDNKTNHVDFELLENGLSSMRKTAQQAIGHEVESLHRNDPTNPIFVPFSLLNILHGTGLRETAHTRVLAWLFDPQQSRVAHGLGEDVFIPVLKWLIGRSSKGTTEWPDDIQNFKVEKALAEKATEDGRRVDIWVEGTVLTTEKPWLVVIEAKLTSELTDQLSFYEEEARRWCEKKKNFLEPIFVYLKDGSEVERYDHEERWIPLSFTDLFTLVWPKIKEMHNAHGYHMARYYLAGVFNDINSLNLTKLNNHNDETVPQIYEILRFMQNLKLKGNYD